MLRLARVELVVVEQPLDDHLGLFGVDKD